MATVPVVVRHKRKARSWKCKIDIQYGEDLWTAHMLLSLDDRGSVKWMLNGEEVEGPDWITPDEFSQLAINVLFKK